VLIHAVTLVDRMVHALVARMQPPPHVRFVSAFPAHPSSHPRCLSLNATVGVVIAGPVVVFGLRTICADDSHICAVVLPTHSEVMASSRESEQNYGY
jgi:hypothetical protein